MIMYKTYVYLHIISCSVIINMESYPEDNDPYVDMEMSANGKGMSFKML